MLLKGREEGEKWREARPHRKKNPPKFSVVGWPKGIFGPARPLFCVKRVPATQTPLGLCPAVVIYLLPSA